jgi:hypothetical protein
MKETGYEHLLILDDPPYGAERSYSGLRRALALLMQVRLDWPLTRYACVLGPRPHGPDGRALAAPEASAESTT